MRDVARYRSGTLSPVAVAAFVLCAIITPRQALAQRTISIVSAQNISDALSSLLEGADIVPSLLVLSRLESSTLPLGTAGGAFTPLIVDNTIRPVSATFGSAFLDRAITSGRGRIAVGGNYITARYSSFGNYSLSNGEFKPFIDQSGNGIGTRTSSRTNQLNKFFRGHALRRLVMRRKMQGIPGNQEIGHADFA